MDLDLEALKTEILDYLERSDFAIFRGYSGGLEGLPMITWDTEQFPDYRSFLDVAQRIGQKLIVLASRELAEDEIDEALEQLEETDFTREEQRDFENRIRGVRRHLGAICSLELAFDHNSHLYVYEARPDWYEDFLDACEEISAELTAGNGDDSGNSGIGGFYSNN